MKKTSFTFLKSRTLGLRNTFLLFFVAFMCNYTTQAQCSLACNGTTNVALDNATCTATITPETILNDGDTSCPNGVFEVIIEDVHGNVIPTSPDVTANEVGQQLYVRVRDTNSGNSCWGYLVVEDKLAPTIDCADAQANIDANPFICYELFDFDLTPFVNENCDIDTIIFSETVNPNDCSDPAMDEVLKTITRIYTVVDRWGNTSEPCTLTFVVNRIDLDDNPIICPGNFTENMGNALECDGDFARDENGNPHPSVTGVPVLDLNGDGDPNTGTQIDLWPDPEYYCNLLTTYSDNVIAQIGCVTKIMRTWTFVEWNCDTRTIDPCIQMIEIVDDEAPTFTCPADFSVTTNIAGGEYYSQVHGEVSCAAHVNLPALDISDNCDNQPIEVDITYPGGFLDNSNGGWVELPLGSNVVTYTVYDGCYNSATCEVVVDVQDHTAPTAICIQNTVVSLTQDGEAEVPASTFDNGSYDDCQLKRFVVRRMNPDPCDCDVPNFETFDYLGERDGSHYYLSKWNMSGHVAKKDAAALGGTPVIYETAAEEAWVHAEVRDIYDGNYWIGLCRSHEGGFEWTDGTPLTPSSYSNWFPGEPNDLSGTENCVHVSSVLNDQWNDTDCFNNPFIGFENGRYVLELKDICGFSEDTKFCCADVGGDDVMVVFRAIDVNGNWNDCMVNVEVQDKLPPKITCPPDMTVDCDIIYDLTNLGLTFGEATADDNCAEMISEIPDVDLNQCNIGRIGRTFTATDAGGRSSSCTQWITFINPEPFGSVDAVAPFGVEFDPINFPGYTNFADDISWPADVDMEGCTAPDDASLHPDVTGWPSFNEDQCDLVGAEWKDHTFSFNNSNNADACLKIIRKWKVIDWCQFTNGLYPVWEYEQIIKVNNSVDPVITSSCDPKSTCTYDTDCRDGFIELTASATDDCTDELTWSYTFDWDFDGETFVPETIPVTGEGNSLDASGTYQVGTHAVRYTFRDRCGNIVSCIQEFSVVNCKAATCYSYQGLATDLMPVDFDNDGEPDGGMIELWASDFDAGSFHSCDYDVILSVDPDTSIKNITFDCSHVLVEQEVPLYVSIVTPMDSLIQTFCIATIDIQDNMMVCPTLPDGMAQISGRIATEKSENLSEVMVGLDGSTMPAEMTNDNGQYAFPQMNLGGEYEVSPNRNTDPLNGVTTLDLSFIQKHILGIRTLDSPYKVIAADVNRDGFVSAPDLNELRKLILGIYEEFPQNDAWRFVDEAYEFDNASAPLNESFPESYLIDDLNQDMEIDFVAVKVGDVNESVITSFDENNTTATRHANTIEFNATDRDFEAGDIVEVALNATKDIDLLGYQFTLGFDTELLNFKEIKTGAIYTDVTHYATHKAEQGMIATSWNTASPTVIAKDAAAFIVVFEAIQDGSLAGNIEINSDAVTAEAYDGIAQTYNVLLTIDSRNETEDALGYVLYQNTPNPFDNSTEISFHLPEAMFASLRIYNVSGKTIAQYSDVYQKGMNVIKVDKEALTTTGILYYTLETENYTATKRMVVIK